MNNKEKNVSFSKYIKVKNVIKIKIKIIEQIEEEIVRIKLSVILVVELSFYRKLGEGKQQ